MVLHVYEHKRYSDLEPGTLRKNPQNNSDLDSVEESLPDLRGIGVLY